MKIVFASNNRHKIREIQDIVGSTHQIIAMADMGITDDIPEPYETFEENARAKAEYVHKRTGLAAFADDSGLEVDALDGAPGVYSARYAGPAKSDEANNAKLLGALRNTQNRKAQFRTVIAFAYRGEYRYFEGVVKGEILEKPIGTQGFGYDPLFKPEGYELSFAQLSMAEKSSISHRGRAVRHFIDHLKLIG